MSRVTVIGAGFAALTAVRKLRAADASLGIDLIAPEPEFVFCAKTEVYRHPGGRANGESAPSGGSGRATRSAKPVDSA